jgi:non-ribosomal peptide synthetase component F
VASEPWSARADTPDHPDGLSVAAEAEAEAPPLSVAQEALWYQSVLFPQEIIYNETVSVRKVGELDVAVLRRAVEGLVGRHEIWRTTFDVIDGEPTQLVHPPPSFELPVLDLSHLSQEQAEARAVQVVSDVSRVPYDIRRGPLLRPRLIRFPGDEHRLYLAMHHIIFDGVSVYRTVLPELVTLYNAFAAGEPSPLSPPAMQYGDFARWEQERIRAARAARRIDYWRKHLTGVAMLTLPTDRPRPEAPRFRGGVHGWDVPAPVVGALRELAQANGVTLFQVLGGMWALLLSRWSDQGDVVFGTAVDLRQRPEFESIVGYCLTPMVVRIELGDDPTCVELLHRARDAVFDGLDHLVPFERVVRELRPNSGHGRNPIYQTMFVMEPHGGAQDECWTLHQMESGVGDALGTTRMDLELELDERPEGHLAGRLIFDRDLYDRDTVLRLSEQLDQIMAAVCANPELTVSEVPLISSAQQQRQVVQWNATVTRLESAAATIDELVARRADHDSAVAAVGDGEQALSHGELQVRADAVAARLRAAGIGRGEVVAVCGAPRVGLVAAALGTLRAGAAHCLIDPQLPVERRDALIAGSSASAVLTLTNDGDADLRLRDRDGRVGDGDACCVLDAGGGPPGVAHHAAVVNLTLALTTELGLSGTDVVAVLPEMLYTSAITELWPALGAGARLVLLTPEQAADGRALSRRIRAERATLLHADPSTWQRLVDSGLRSSRTLRALCGPGRLDRDLADAILARCRVLFNAHGSPYATGLSTFAQIGSEGPITIGRPLANCRAYVVDRFQRPVAVGITGRLLLAGVGVTAPPVSAGADGGTRDPFAGGPAVDTGERARWLADGRLALV